MKQVLEKEKCCGCSACFNICPVDAIKMIDDNDGFKYPVIDEEKCIKCNLCQKTCPVLNSKFEIIKNQNIPKCYACYNKNIKDRINSSSGGIFALIAKYILNQNGLVVGAAFDENFMVRHIVVENENDLEKLYGSKYVESDIDSIYKEIKKILKKGKKVLFAGTPCQVSGLKQYLKKDYDNLYTQDIICHGVPSKKVWKKYLKERYKNSRIKSINFRNKKYGWDDFSLRVSTNNKDSNLSHNDDPYMQFFLSNICLRPSCYNCEFKKGNIASDITLGDFWGIDNFNKELNDNKGVSLIIINNEKGKKIFDEIKNETVFEEVSLIDVIPYNEAIEKSVEQNKNRSSFFNDLDNLSLIKLHKKYGVQKKWVKFKLEYLKKEVKLRLKK